MASISSLWRHCKQHQYIFSETVCIRKTFWNCTDLGQLIGKSIIWGIGSQSCISYNHMLWNINRKCFWQLFYLWGTGKAGILEYPRFTQSVLSVSLSREVLLAVVCRGSSGREVGVGRGDPAVRRNICGQHRRWSRRPWALSPGCIFHHLLKAKEGRKKKSDCNYK